jgi:hypothetical protein
MDHRRLRDEHWPHSCGVVVTVMTGAHYLVDVLATVVIFTASVWLWRRVWARWIDTPAPAMAAAVEALIHTHQRHLIPPRSLDIAELDALKSVPPWQPVRDSEDPLIHSRLEATLRYSSRSGSSRRTKANCLTTTDTSWPSVGGCPSTSHRLMRGDSRPARGTPSSTV